MPLDYLGILAVKLERWSWVRDGKNRGSVDQSQGETKFDARNGFIDMFVQMSLDNSIVVDAKPLAEGVLRDLETPVNVAP